MTQQTNAIEAAKQKIGQLEQDLAAVEAERGQVQAVLDRYEGLDELNQDDLLDLENHKRRNRRLCANRTELEQALSLARAECADAEIAAKKAHAAELRAELATDTESLMERAREFEAEMRTRLASQYALRDRAFHAALAAAGGERVVITEFETLFTKLHTRDTTQRAPTRCVSDVLDRVSGRV